MSTPVININRRKSIFLYPIMTGLFAVFIFLPARTFSSAQTLKVCPDLYPGICLMEDRPVSGCFTTPPARSDTAPEMALARCAGEQTKWTSISTDIELSKSADEGSFDLYELYLTQPNLKTIFEKEDLFYYLTEYDHEVLRDISIDGAGRLTYHIVEQPHGAKTRITAAYVPKQGAHGKTLVDQPVSIEEIVSSAYNPESVVYDTIVVFDPQTYEETIHIRATTVGEKLMDDQELPGPLVVLDGIIMKSGFDIATLEVDKIESVNILKGAKATERYGEAGRYGVVLIKTVQ